jgi:hypothetical protein
LCSKRNEEKRPIPTAAKRERKLFKILSLPALFNFIAVGDTNIHPLMSVDNPHHPDLSIPFPSGRSQARSVSVEGPGCCTYPHQRNQAFVVVDSSVHGADSTRTIAEQFHDVDSLQMVVEQMHDADLLQMLAGEELVIELESQAFAADQRQSWDPD